MKRYCATGAGLRGWVLGVGEGETPEQCAANAVENWLQSGRLSIPFRHGEAEEVEVHVDMHGDYVVRLDAEMRISEARKKQDRND